MKKALLLALAVGLSVIPGRSAVADEGVKQVISCNTDGSYTCGNTCDLGGPCNWCCKNCAQE